MKNIYVCKETFEKFMEKNKEKIECIASPANAFVYMTGGYDLAISNYFGWGFQKIVQRYIIDKYYREQPVGSSFLIKDNNSCHRKKQRNKANIDYSAN